jgi:hypothetical protein
LPTAGEGKVDVSPGSSLMPTEEPKNIFQHIARHFEQLKKLSLLEIWSDSFVLSSASWKSCSSATADTTGLSPDDTQARPGVDVLFNVTNQIDA